MDIRSIAKQSVCFNKAAMDNGFSAMMMAQEQMEILTGAFLNQIPGFPVEGKKAIENWSMAYRNGCDLFRKAIFGTFEQIEDLIKE